MPRILRRNKKGRFAKYGTYQSINGKLSKIKPQPRPPRPAPVARPAGRAREIERPPSRPRGERVPTVTRPARPSGRLGAKFSTWFRAIGSAGNLRDMRGAESPDLLSEDLEQFAAPAAFYSNQSGLLGRVRFKGVVGLEILIDKLNLVLQFTGEETRDFDFRNVYENWEYRYQVIETIGPTDRVIEERRDHS